MANNIVKDYLEASTSQTYTIRDSLQFRRIIVMNDGTSDLTFTLDGLTIKVTPDDVSFEGEFDNWFTSIVISASGPYRILFTD